MTTSTRPAGRSRRGYRWSSPGRGPPAGWAATRQAWRPGSRPPWRTPGPGRPSGYTRYRPSTDRWTATGTSSATSINTEVTGFVLQADGLPTVYISGDNASVEPVLRIHEHFPAIDVAVLHIGAARVAAKNAGRPLTLTADRASDVALILGVTAVVPAHCDGWSIYSQTCTDVERSFHDAGITDRLRTGPLGTWALRHDSAPPWCRLHWTTGARGS